MGGVRFGLALGWVGCALVVCVGFANGMFRKAGVVRSAPTQSTNQVLKLSLLSREWSRGGSACRPAQVLHTVLMSCL